MMISPATRRDVVDALSVEDIGWSGRLEESEFLSRLFDLKSLPSDDRRFPDAAGDVWQHRVNNSDWEDDWVFYDRRFNILNGDDDLFLRFLCETIHPAVRSDATEVERLVQLYNSYLRNDGFQLVEKARMAGRPVYAARYVGAAPAPGVLAARKALAPADIGYVAQQITRMETAVNEDPDLAIGTAKELVETCCKTILKARGVTVPGNQDLPQLVKQTVKELRLTPDDIPEKAKAANTMKRLLSNLASITSGVAELRNLYGTGHGREAQSLGMTSRHAKLAVGSASTLAVFLMETHQERPRGRK